MSAEHAEIIRVLKAAAPKRLKLGELYDRGDFLDRNAVAMAPHEMKGVILDREGDRGTYAYGIREGADPDDWLRNRKTRKRAEKADRIPAQPTVRVVHSVKDRQESATPATKAKQPASGPRLEITTKPVEPAANAEQAKCPECGGPMTRFSIVCKKCYPALSKERKAELGIDPGGPRTHPPKAQSSEGDAAAGVQSAPAAAVVERSEAALVRDKLKRLLRGAYDDLREYASAHPDEKIRTLAWRVNSLEELFDEFAGER